ncbi:hypothetical protein MPLDJ20_220059 [Mesorhizobium plurifarium]|uniref:Uncharacterized protein n=1 Tax=Mesorhizobium plurifarium TaxID=69974 RepID=A0A090F8U5_MESPL|nr:hypothetical protein MPLDJ20_220059 [Mesorhizobium plurifarium]
MRVAMRVRAACRVERILVFDLTPTCKPLSFDCIEKPFYVGAAVKFRSRIFSNEPKPS